MAEEDQELSKFVCKYCDKNFASGKSLGGHMRGHLALISAEKDEEDENGDLGFEESSKNNKVLRASEPSDHNNPSTSMQEKGRKTGLRENPKKSWRVSDSKIIGSNNLNHCKECGKGFNSMRALSGHMRSHSLKGIKEFELNLCQKCGKGFESKRALYGHMRSHVKRSKPSSEESEGEDEKSEQEAMEIVKKPIRKKRSSTRYKINASNASFCSSLNSFSFSSLGEDEEVEEVAMCLMMLSKGVRSWDCGNSAIVEEQSLVHTKGSDLIEKNKVEFGNFDSGFSSRNGGERVEFEVSLSVDDYITKNHSELELEKDRVSEVGSGQEFGSRGKSYDQENTEATDSEILNELMEQEFDMLKRNKEHKCSICFKVFGSGQALGGHKRSHYIEQTESRATEIELVNQPEFTDIHRIFDLDIWKWPMVTLGSSHLGESGAISSASHC